MAIRTLTIPGKQAGWLSTGIKLNPGQTAKISASGIISFGPFGSWPTGPEGQADGFAEGAAPAPGLTKNSLVARAGGLPQQIGSYGEITSEGGSVLQIAANDDFASDNDGSWTVNIEF